MKRLLLALVLWLPALACAGSPQPQAAPNVSPLQHPPAHGTPIHAPWSRDCPKSEPNLEALAGLQRANPHGIELVTVTTDSIALRTAIEVRLRSMKMDGYPARAYAEASPEHINFLLDPDWGGETPRVLVIRADGSLRGISGALTPAQLRRIP
ncbi:MAG: hypothetical protein OJI74_10995 [Rhodanobacter thiooxydans]|nr:hypothetical protein [Rhodanobacter thiooxydans]